MKKFTFALIASAAFSNFASATPVAPTCVNGWPTLANCGVDIEIHRIKICANPENSSEVTINTLDVAANVMTVEKGALSNGKNGETLIETPNSKKYSNLKLVPMVGRLASGSRKYAPNAEVLASDVSEFTCAMAKK